MKSERIGYLLLLLAAVLVVSSAALSAQEGSEDPVQATAEATAEGTMPVLFDDLRINNRIILGEFGIFCEDAQGEAANTYAGGGISVYGANGEHYISVPEEALRQLSDVEMTSDATDEPTMLPTNTLSANMTPTQRPAILLGQAYATNGLAQLFLVGDNQFQLIGFLPDGKGFSYEWTGCAGTAGITTFEGTRVFMTTTPVATLPARTAQPTMGGMVTAQPTLEVTLGVTVAATNTP